MLTFIFSNRAINEFNIYKKTIHSFSFQNMPFLIFEIVNNDSSSTLRDLLGQIATQRMQEKHFSFLPTLDSLLK